MPPEAQAERPAASGKKMAAGTASWEALPCCSAIDVMTLQDNNR